MSPFRTLDTFVTDSYVSMEKAWTGNSYARLRSRPDLTSIGPWEEYRLWCVDPANGYYAIQSFGNGDYVSAEIGWTGNRRGLLRAPEPDHGGSLGDLLHGLVRHLLQRVRLPRRQASGRRRSTSAARRFWLPWVSGPRDYYD
jgi:hypothetical protein